MNRSKTCDFCAEPATASVIYHWELIGIIGALTNWARSRKTINWCASHKEDALRRMVRRNDK